MAGERILVCDDGRESRDFIIEYILQANNYQPLVARNGLEALQVAREERPDLILLDLQMPKMNGMQVLDAMNEEGIEIPVVLMTFHGSEEIAVEVYRKGVRDYVKKPFSVEEMTWAIDRTLDAVRLRNEKEALTERLIAANADMNQRIRELNTLYNIGKSVTALVGLDELFPRIVRAAIEITRAESGSLFLLKGDELVCRATKPPRDAQVHPMSQPVSDPFAWQAIRTGKPFTVGPAELEARRQQNPNLPIAVLATPMVVGGRVIGTLHVSNFEASQKPFSKQDAAMLSALSDYAAIAIENATNFTELARVKENEIDRIKSALGRYVSPTLLDHAMGVYQQELPSQRTEICILIAEVLGYEASVANTSPDQLVGALNHHLDQAVAIISQYGGTVEKYLGNGIIAYFNTPEPQNDYAMQAVTAAISLHEAAQQQGDGLGFSIALHAGHAVVGNVGAIRGLQYSAVGDMVQVVQRIQEKTQLGQTLITEDVVPMIDENQVEATYLGQITARDRQQRINVYRVSS